MIPSGCPRVLRLWLPVLLAAGSSVASGQQARTVILVRHAERAVGTSPEVGISEAGRCRAEALAGMLADAGVRHIFTSEVARTGQTAAPLARILNLAPEVVPAKDVDALVAKLRSGPVGSAALVVGHSNTVPEIIERLGGGAVAPIGDSEYDRLFVVTFTGFKRATVVSLHYRGCAHP
jgi:phosphohistidine phosphatase SixA